MSKGEKRNRGRFSSANAHVMRGCAQTDSVPALPKTNQQLCRYNARDNRDS